MSESSNVYFTNMRTKPGKDLLTKLKLLTRQTGIDSLDFEGKFVAIKIHFGEPGNLAYIRPNYVRVISDIVKQGGGKPFLTDANTLYMGRRANGVDHLQAALENGFTEVVTGCNVIIADGVKGTDYREIQINEKYCSSAKIASAVADADIIISMNHFKGHELTGFGGALKNLGMGCGSVGGKLEMHSTSKPKIKGKRCVSCGMCLKNCLQHAISYNENNKAFIDEEKCVGCGQCIAICQFDAAQVQWNKGANICGEKIAEYTKAVLKEKQHFHINFITQVSPDCDCWGNNDAPIVPDIGIAASFDPVALDMACVDMVNRASALSETKLTDSGFNEGDDKFTCVHSNTDWKKTMDHAELIHIGKKAHTLITV